MRRMKATAVAMPPMEQPPPIPVYQDEKGIIAAFGGARQIQIALGFSLSRISNWRESGIPQTQFHRLVELARMRGIPGITYDLLFEIRERREAILGRGEGNPPFPGAKPPADGEPPQ